jgi:hypothetical protein
VRVIVCHSPPLCLLNPHRERPLSFGHPFQISNRCGPLPPYTQTIHTNHPPHHTNTNRHPYHPSSPTHFNTTTFTQTTLPKAFTNQLPTSSLRQTPLQRPPPLPHLHQHWLAPTRRPKLPSPPPSGPKNPLLELSQSAWGSNLPRRPDSPSPSPGHLQPRFEAKPVQLITGSLFVSYCSLQYWQQRERGENFWSSQVQNQTTSSRRLT